MKPSCSRSFSVHDDNGHLVPEGLSTKLYDLDEKSDRGGENKNEKKKKTTKKSQGYLGYRATVMTNKNTLSFVSGAKKRVVSG